MNVLIIEDEQEVRAMIAMILTAAGHDVSQAANGLEAAALLEKEAPYDLVITDILMPEKEGIETIKELKSQWPQTRILAISGGGIGMSGDYLDLALAMGADEALGKPFGRKELLMAVERLQG